MRNEILLGKIRSLNLCLSAHPDNCDNSEFADRICDLEEIEDSLKKEIESSIFIPNMNERLQKVKDILEQFQSYSYGDQYGNADWVETNPELMNQNNLMSQEVQIYKEAIEKIEKLIS
jgi:hypothetical protein